MLTSENDRLAKHAGATQSVAHSVDLPSTDRQKRFGVKDNRNRPRTCGELAELKRAVNGQGLELAAIENSDPSGWYDVLPDGPRQESRSRMADRTFMAFAMGYIKGILNILGAE